MFRRIPSDFKPIFISNLYFKRWCNSIHYQQLPPFSRASRRQRLNGNFSSWMWQGPKPKMGEMKPQKFDYLAVLDFEATCGRNGNQPKPQEIIEFPCALLNVRAGFEVEAIFHKYVRPVHHPLLTSFCTELTGITQVKINFNG